MKIIATLIFAAALAGCTTHVSSGVSYEFSTGSGTVHPSVSTFNDKSVSPN